MGKITLGRAARTPRAAPQHPTLGGRAVLDLPPSHGANMAHHLFAGKPQYLLKLPQGPKLRMNRRVRWFRRSARPVRQWPQWSNARAHTSVLERRKSEASVLRDFEEAGELVIYEEFGQDIADIAHLAQHSLGERAAVCRGAGPVWRWCHRRCLERSGH